MTLEQFLFLRPGKQALEAAKCFTEKPWEHDFDYASDHYPESQNVCTKCYAPRKKWRDPCSLPDPLTLDWNTAKRLQGECDEKSFYQGSEETWRYLRQIETNTYPLHYWLNRQAQPIHYIAACMAAKGYFKENESERL